jgi:hypothetical protein
VGGVEIRCCRHHEKMADSYRGRATPTVFSPRSLLAPEQWLRFYTVLAKFYEPRQARRSANVSDFLAHARLALFGVNVSPLFPQVGQSEART